MMSHTTFQVYSPDGFSIMGCTTFKTQGEAKRNFDEWAKRYEAQGYYASVKGRIPLNQLEESCLFKKLDRHNCSPMDIVFCQDIVSSKIQ